MPAMCIWLSEVDSTNQYVKEHIDSFKSGTVIVADHQTGGRGSKGRSWISREGEGLYVSFIKKENEIKYSEELGSLPLLMGLTAATALEKEGICGVEIKWPNDLLLHQYKISGILCETQIQKNKTAMIFGIGINLITKKEYFQEAGIFRASSILAETGKKLERESLLNTLTGEFNKNYTKWITNGFTPFMTEYTHKSATVGKEIWIFKDGQKMMGKAISVEKDGRLLCDMQGNLCKISQAEVSIRENMCHP